MANEYGLITDRSQDHVARLKKLRSIGYNNMTDSQKAEYRDYATRGAYNYTDLNRVETVVKVLASRIGLTLTTKTDWGFWDIPSQSQMERYLGNVVAIRDVCPGGLGFPPLPDSMNHLTYEDANNIEKVLEIAYQYITYNPNDDVLGKGVLGKMVLGREL
jgi:hypothetical protein